MQVGTTGVLVDPHGNVLLIRRNDTRTYAPPGGALDAGELPTDGVAREIREETGLIVMPVRLVSLNFLPLKPNGYLSFTFRCLMRGGEIKTSPESPLVGFFPAHSLPGPMTGFHRQRLEVALSHDEERPYWLTQPVTTWTKIGRFVLNHVVYRWLDLRRRWRRQPPYVPPPPWQTAVYVLIQNEAGEIFWWQRQSTTLWELPGGQLPAMMAPWTYLKGVAAKQTGFELSLTNLAAAYVTENDSRLTLLFTAVADNDTLNSDGAYFPLNAPPDKALAPHHALLPEKLDQPGTIFRRLPDAP